MSNEQQASKKAASSSFFITPAASLQKYQWSLSNHVRHVGVSMGGYGGFVTVGVASSISDLAEAKGLAMSHEADHCELELPKPKRLKLCDVKGITWCVY